MTTSKNALFCLKNLGLAKEHSHTSADFSKHNDIVQEKSFRSQVKDAAHRHESCRRMRLTKLLVRGSLIVAGGAAGFAVEQSVGAESNVNHRLAKTTVFLALAGGLGLLALHAFIFGRTSSGAHVFDGKPACADWET